MEGITSIPSLSRGNKNRIQGKFFPGHHSQSRSSSSENFGSPFRRESRGKNDPTRTLTAKSGHININPEARSETSDNIGRNIKSRLRGNGHQVFQKLWTLLQKSWTQTIKVEPPRSKRSPRYFSEIPRCWTAHPPKKKTPLMGR